MFFAENVEIKKKEIQVPVQEKYFGKDRDTKELENEFKNAINKKGDYNFIKVQKILEKKFGFNKVIVLVDKNDKTLNANTFYNNDDVNQAQLVNGEYKLKPGNKYTMFLSYSGAMFGGAFSPSELTAITLHEVGHHFAAKVKLLNLNLSMMQSFMTGMEQVEKAWKIKPDSSSVLKLAILYAAPGVIYLCCLYNILKYIVVLFDSAITMLTALDLMVTSEGRAKIFKRLTENTKNLFIRVSPLLLDTEEQLADSFAVILGYGPELTSALSKLEAQVEEQSWGLQYLNNWYSLPLYILLGWGDPRTYGIQSHARVNIMLRTLSMELKDSSNNDKDVKQILKDLEAIEDQFTIYLEKRDKANMDKRAIAPLWDIFQTSLFKNLCRGNRTAESSSYEALKRLIKTL
jgi:hypothetical protein